MQDSSDLDDIKEILDVSNPVDNANHQENKVKNSQTERQRMQESLKQSILEFKEGANAKKNRQDNVQMTQGGQRTSDAKKIGNYVIGKVLGQGTFGKVRLGTHALTQEKVAIKILEKEKIKDEQEAMRIMREINILKIVRHPNIVQLYEIIETSRQLYLIMEYSPNGELFDYIVKKRKLQEGEASRFYRQIVAGVEYLHQNKISHRDLKPENLLLDENMNIKIVDFGLSIMYKNAQAQVLKTACGSPCYAPPEMILGKKYSGLSTDIWTLGIILYAMTVGYLPFEDKDTNKLYKKILSCDYLVPGFLSSNVKDLMRKIIQVKPEKRTSLAEIKNHPWCQNAPTPLDGIIVSKDKIPTLEVILQEVRNLPGIEKFGQLEELNTYIQNNRHNTLTATYYLVIKKYERGTDQDLVFGKFMRDRRLEKEKLAKAREETLSQEQTKLNTENSAEGFQNLEVEDRQKSENNKYSHSDRKVTVYNGQGYRQRVVSRGEYGSRNKEIISAANQKRMNSTQGGDVFAKTKQVAESLLKQSYPNNSSREDPYSTFQDGRAIMQMITDKQKKQKKHDISTISQNKQIAQSQIKPMTGPDVIRQLRNKKNNIETAPQGDRMVRAKFVNDRSQSPEMSQTIYGTMHNATMPQHHSQKVTRNQFALQQQAILMRSQQVTKENPPYDDIQEIGGGYKNERSASVDNPKSFYVENIQTLNDSVYLSQQRIKAKQHHRNLSQAVNAVKNQRAGLHKQSPWTTQQHNDKDAQQNMMMTQQNFQQAKISAANSPNIHNINTQNRKIKIPVNKLVGQRHGQNLIYTNQGDLNFRKVQDDLSSVESLQAINAHIRDDKMRQNGNASVSLQNSTRQIIHSDNNTPEKKADITSYGLRKARGQSIESFSRNLNNGAVIIQTQQKGRVLNTAGQMNNGSLDSFRIPKAQKNASFQQQTHVISQVKNNFMVQNAIQINNNMIKVAAVSGPPSQTDGAHSVDRVQNLEPRINLHAPGNQQKTGFMQARNAKQRRASQPTAPQGRQEINRPEYQGTADELRQKRVSDNSWVQQADQANPYQLQDNNNTTAYFTKTSIQGEKFIKQNLQNNRLIIKQ